MGASASKDQGHGGQVLHKSPKTTQPPYRGSPLSYHFVNVEASLQLNTCFGYIRAGATINTLNVNSYLPILNQLYEQGLRMLSFTATPGTIKTHGFASFDATSTIRFQGIFRTTNDHEDRGKYQIRIEKSLLQSQTFLTGTGFMIGRDVGSVSNTDHIYQTIANVTSTGSRFICLEITGFSPLGMGPGMMPGQYGMHGHGHGMHGMHGMHGHGMHGMHGMHGHGMHDRHHMQQQMMMFGYSPQITVGVDLFFETPLLPNPELYSYSIVPLPINARFTVQMPHGRWDVSCDWAGLMQYYLGQGWRLVEVFMDQSQQSSIQGFGFNSSMDMTMNSIWVFEKPMRRMDDSTPIYEGTMIEFPVSVTYDMHAMGFAGVSTNVQANWEPTITDMGQNGWELVRILQTPGTNVSGMFKPVITITMWMFFQRKIISLEKPDSPPTYLEAVGK